MIGGIKVGGPSTRTGLVIGALEAGSESSTRAGESSAWTGAAKAGTACLTQTGGAMPMGGDRLTCDD